MSWDAVAVFATDARMWLLPILAGGVFVATVVLRRGRVGALAWKGVIHLESFLVGLMLGLLYGPRWPSRVAEAVSGSEVSVTWDAVLTGLVLVGAFIALAFSVRRLLQQPGLQWVGLLATAYTVGVTLHVILLRGQPILEAFGGTA
jgi:hypothetical protein